MPEPLFPDPVEPEPELTPPPPLPEPGRPPLVLVPVPFGLAELTPGGSAEPPGAVVAVAANADAESTQVSPAIASALQSLLFMTNPLFFVRSSVGEHLQASQNWEIKRA